MINTMMVNPHLKEMLQMEIAVLGVALIFIIAATMVIVRGVKIGAISYYNERRRFIKEQILIGSEDLFSTHQ